MSKETKLKPITAALGATFAVSLMSSPIVSAEANPFSMIEHGTGYMVADSHEGKCGEGKCGGEGKKDKEGCCGDKHKAEGEGKCGEGKCGGEKKK